MTLIRSVGSSSRLYLIQNRMLLYINKYAVCQFVFGQFGGEGIYTGENLTDRKLIS